MAASEVVTSASSPVRTPTRAASSGSGRRRRDRRARRRRPRAPACRRANRQGAVAVPTRLGVLLRGRHRVAPLQARRRGICPVQIVGVGPLERRQAGQDHVCVSSRFVEPLVHRNHCVESAERGVRSATARSRDHRVAHDGDQSTDLTVTRSVDLFCETADWELPEHFRCAPYAAVERPNCQPSVGWSGGS